jgi:hypothetical protein
MSMNGAGSPMAMMIRPKVAAKPMMVAISISNILKKGLKLYNA